MCEKGGKGKKASFRVNGRGRGLKSAKGPRKVRRSRSPARSSSPQITFAEYNISHIPVAARPCQSKENKGRHGYTLCSQDGSRARIEVLLRQKAFFLQRFWPTARQDPSASCHLGSLTLSNPRGLKPSAASDLLA